MHAWRTRSLITSIVLMSGALSVTVSPASAATCALTAPPSVAIGSALTIQGSGFPASTAVDVSITVDAGAPDEFPVQSDAAGSFEVNLTPEAADQGQMTVVASAGAGCTAQVVIAVGQPAGGSTPEPSDNGVAGKGAAPRTDSAPASLPGPAAPGIAVWLAFILLSSGIGGLVLTRPARSR